ncbi:42320_t:CDS:1, partial [Gigaspora margarita]
DNNTNANNISSGSDNIKTFNVHANDSEHNNSIERTDQNN